MNHVSISNPDFAKASVRLRRIMNQLYEINEGRGQEIFIEHKKIVECKEAIKNTKALGKSKDNRQKQYRTYQLRFWEHRLRTITSFPFITEDAPAMDLQNTFRIARKPVV